MRPDLSGRPGGPWEASLQHVIGLSKSSGFITKFPPQTCMCKVEGLSSLMLEMNKTRGQTWGRKVGCVCGKGGPVLGCSRTHVRINTKIS